MQKDALVVVGSLWSPCSAGLFKFCMAIIIGLCARSKVLALTYSTKSMTGKFSLVHYIGALNPPAVESWTIVLRVYSRQE